MNGTGWGITNNGTLSFSYLNINDTPTIQPNASFSITGSGLYVSSGVTFSPTGGTITFTNASWILNTSGATLGFYNLTIAGTPSSQPSTSFSIAGMLTVNSPYTFAPSGGTITFTGTAWGITNNGSLTFKGLTIAGTPLTQPTASFNIANTLTVNSSQTFSPTAGTITFTGSLWTISNGGTLGFYGLTIGGTPSSQPSASFSVAGTLTVNPSATFSPTGTTTITGSLSVQSSGTFYPMSGTVIFSGTAWIITNSGSLTFNNLTIAGTPATQTSSSFYINGTLTVNSGQTFAPTGGTISTSSSIFVIANSGTLSFKNLTIFITPITQTSATFAVTGTLTVNSSQTFAPTGGTITITGGISVGSGATFSPTGGTVTFSGAAWTMANSGTLAFYNLTIAGTPMSQPMYSFSIKGMLTVNNGVTFSPSGTTTFTGTAWGITNNGTLTFWSLTIAGTPTTQPSVSFSIAGMLTVNSSQTLAPTSGTITMTGTAWGITNNGTLTFKGLAIAGTPSTQPTASFSIANTLTLNSSIAFSPTAGTITFPGTAWIIINNGTLTFYGLTIANTPSTQPSASFSVAGTLTVDSGATFAPTASAYTFNNVTINGALTAPANMNITGNWTNAGTFTHSNGTVVFTPTSTSIITGNNTFYDLTCEAQGKTLTFESGSLQTIKGTLTLKGAMGNPLVFNSTSTAQWKISPEDIIDVGYLNGYNSNNTGPAIYDPTSTFTNCTGWFPNLRPVPPPPAPPATPMINDALFFPNFIMPEMPIQTTLSNIALVMGPGVVVAVPVVTASVATTPASGSALAPATSFGTASHTGIIPSPQTLEAFKGVTASAVMPEKVSFEGVRGTSIMPQIVTSEAFKGVTGAASLPKPVSFEGVFGSSTLPAKASFKGVKGQGMFDKPLNPSLFDKLTGEAKIKIAFPDNQSLSMSRSSGLPLGIEKESVDPNTDKK